MKRKRFITTTLAIAAIVGGVVLATYHGKNSFTVQAPAGLTGTTAPAKLPSDVSPVTGANITANASQSAGTALGNTGAPPQGTGTAAPSSADLASAPTLSKSERQAVARYLVQSNAITMPTTNMITLNILEARDGKPQPLLDTARQISAAAKSLMALTPPPSLTDFHNSSVADLTAYANELTKVANAGNSANMLTILNSAQMNALRQDGRAQITFLRALMAKNAITLAPDVLPNTPLPPLTSAPSTNL